LKNFPTKASCASFCFYLSNPFANFATVAPAFFLLAPGGKASEPHHNKDTSVIRDGSDIDCVHRLRKKARYERQPIGSCQSAGDIYSRLCRSNGKR
jgi:hypothetical protein